MSRSADNHVIILGNGTFCDTPFWNGSAIWNTTNPAFTPCFTDTVMCCLPAALLLASLPVTLLDYLSSRRPSIAPNRFNILKFILAIALTFVGLAHAIYISVRWFSTDPTESFRASSSSLSSSNLSSLAQIEIAAKISISQLFGTLISSLTYCLLPALIIAQRIAGFANSAAIWFYLLSQLICRALSIPTFRLRYDQNQNYLEPIFVSLESVLHFCLFILHSYADRVRQLGVEQRSSFSRAMFEAKPFFSNDSIDDYHPDHHEDDNNFGKNRSYKKGGTKSLKRRRRRICPKEVASFPAKLTFWWFDSLAILGFRRSLTIEDLWPVRDADRATLLFHRFNHYWRHRKFGSTPSGGDIEDQRNKYCDAAKNTFLLHDFSFIDDEDEGSESEHLAEQAKHKKDFPQSIRADSRQFTAPPQTNIWLLLAKQFWRHFSFPTAARFVTDNLQLVNPLVMKFMISFGTDRDAPFWHGLLFTAIFVLTNLVSSLTSAYHRHRMSTLGMRIRSSLLAAIFRKSLVLAMHAKKRYSTGEIVNLMAVDCQRFIDLLPIFFFLWTAPVQVCIALSLLYTELGVSIFAGSALLVLFIPLNAYIAGVIKRIQSKQMALKDKRLKAINEMLNGMKVLKLYAWEEAFMRNIQSIRRRELAYIRRAGYISTIFNIITACSPFMVSCITFAVYIFLDPIANVLTAEKAFVSIALFNLLRIPLAMVPHMISNLIMTLVSVKRLNQFLNAPETMPYIRRSIDRMHAITIRDVSFSWQQISRSPTSSSSDLITLRNLNLSIRRGTLVAIVGPVGCGKSSLFYALLGEMQPLIGPDSGFGPAGVNISGDLRLAYVAQQAWIQHGSVRDNILFGGAYLPRKYHRVIDACALRADFAMLPGGDRTEIGEKGINLSGGQKQRVGIARACYADADLHLFDDPLSAVDSHVGRHIFDNVLSSQAGLLRHTTRILVTNALYVLPQVDQIVLMREGEIEAVGSYDQLMEGSAIFVDLIRNYAANPASDEDKSSVKTKEKFSTVAENVDSGDESRKIIDTIKKPTKTDEPKEEEEDNDEKKDQEEDPKDQEEDIRLMSAEEGDLCADANVEVIRTLSQGSVTLRAEINDRRNSSVSGTNRKKSSLLPSPPAKLVEAEHLESGQINMAIYMRFFRSISIRGTGFIFATYLLVVSADSGSHFWLAHWTSTLDHRSDHNRMSSSSSASPSSSSYYLLVYFAFGMTQMFLVTIGWIAIVRGTLRASRTLHCGLLSSVVRAPMHFFDTTPLGRIVNRFSKDIDVLDSSMQLLMRVLLTTVLKVFATLFIVSYQTPIFLAIVAPFLCLFIALQRFYLRTSRQLKRLESISRSPIFSHFCETINGSATIKAFDGAATRFIAESDRRIDENQRCCYPSAVAACWLQIRLELLANCLIFFAALFSALAKKTDASNGLDASGIGLSLSYALNVTLPLTIVVRMFADFEHNLISVERISEYVDGGVPAEASWRCDRDDILEHVNERWPQNGEIHFEWLAARYRPGLDFALRRIDFDIRRGEKIAIVGRTGAGKSSLTLALFRLIEPASGRITIDGIDISTLGLHTLRSRLTILPQEAILFAGTIRSNLDPFERYHDAQLWRSLDLAHLKRFVGSLPLGLYHVIDESGDNLSAGQRQLMCLARALLRRTATTVLVLDEATAAVDAETDALIQRTIRSQFAHCTVLTIAHRLSTIIDYDRVLLLDQGSVAEFDTPQSLLANPRSLFYSLAKHAEII